MSRTPIAFACPRPRRALTLPAALCAAALVSLVAADLASAHHRAGRPHAPQPLRAVAHGSTSVVLTWKKTARTFLVAKNGRRVAKVHRARYRATGLTCGRPYRFAVRAVTRAGKRSRAVMRRVTPPCPPPPVPGPPQATQAPHVTGTPRVGRVLHASTGSWQGTTPMTFAYEWQRCDAAGANCAPISGATTSNRLLDSADAGATLRVLVSATNAEGSASALSQQTAVISAGGGSSTCSRADATGCATVAGSRIRLVNQRFSCDRSLAQIAAANPIGAGPGRLPLLVEVGFTTYVDLNPAVIELKDGCHGDGDDETIDLVVQVEGDGRAIGGTSDAVKVRLTARDVQLTGYANCGPRGVGSDGRPGTGDDAHQDGAQIQGGNTIEFIDFEWGDWDTSTATCQGAAGTFVPGSVNGNPVHGMACIRCKSVSCNHGMFVGGSNRTLVVDSSWRSGNPAERSVVLANGQVGLCNHGSQACSVAGPSEAYELTILRNYCDRWPYGDGQ